MHNYIHMIYVCTYACIYTCVGIINVNTELILDFQYKTCCKN